MSNPLYWIAAKRFALGFPSPEDALDYPDGLLAAGGDLTHERLLEAYRQGIFPWYEHGQPLLWWSPDPRTILFPDQIKISRSLRRTLLRGHFQMTMDKDFSGVMRACAEPRKNQNGTWITEAILEAYGQLHAKGHAHSVECWHQGALAGGLYGVSIGQVFFGESMFSRMDDASKVCLIHLASRLRDWDYRLIDCQVHTGHLERLGAICLPRKEFVGMLQHWCATPPRPNAWHSCGDE
jgi:leucyl/phenylalanyl-tRNA--protein transferase